MSGNRAARIALLVAEEAARRGRPLSLVDVCASAVAALPIGGAGVSAMSPTVVSYPLCSTDAASEQLLELQLTLGEGPCVDAFARGSTVWAPDLSADEAQGRWPVFAPAAVDAGARAVYAFPLQIGAISPGVLDLYSQLPLVLSASELTEAMAFADCAPTPTPRTAACQKSLPTWSTAACAFPRTPDPIRYRTRSATRPDQEIRPRSDHSTQSSSRRAGLFSNKGDRHG